MLVARWAGGPELNVMSLCLFPGERHHLCVNPQGGRRGTAYIWGTHGSPPRGNSKSLAGRSQDSLPPARPVLTGQGHPHGPLGYSYFSVMTHSFPRSSFCVGPCPHAQGGTAHSGAALVPGSLSLTAREPAPSDSVGSL